MSLIKEARDIASHIPVADLAGAHLRKVADDLQEAYDILKISCTREAVTNFVAQFTRTMVAIERVHENNPPAPNGGAMPVPFTGDQASARGSG